MAIMATIPLQEPHRRGADPHGFALLALGFRPFFLLAGLFAALALPLWLLTLSAHVPLPPYYGALWHAHEMLFGFAVAVVAGFLLTATRNWTGIQTLQGSPLAALALLWVAARLLVWLPLPGALIAAVDLAFLPLLALALAVPVTRARQWHNLLFTPILLLMALANGLIHLELLGGPAVAERGLQIMVVLMLVLLALMGGRVIPFFIERAVPGSTVRRFRLLEWGVHASLWALLVAIIWPGGGQWATVAAGAAALLHALRLAGWSCLGLWRVPMLWILWLGYGWIVVGLALYAAGLAGAALHAWTAGGIGALTLGMMARVALGHTGRLIEPARLTVAAFALINLAVLLRVAGPLLLPEHYLLWMQLSGLLWATAFLLFSLVYAPILWRPRIDGRDG